MEEKSKLFYDDLVGSGYKLPDYETFKTSLQDQSKADAFYKDLSSSGFKLPDFDTFYGVFKPADTTQVAPQQVTEQPVERIPTNGIADFVGNINQTILKIPADIAETWAIASAFTERQLAKAGLPGADPNIKASDVSLGLPITKVTDEYRGMVESIAPVSEEFKGTFAGGVSQGLGQAAGMLLSGGGSRATEIAKMTKSVGGSLTPIVNAGKELLKNVGSRQGLIGGSMNASANYRQAIDDGATEEEALRYGIENMVVGSVMENLPIQSMFSRISKMEPGAKILDVVKNGLVGAGEEAVTEGFQTTYENLSAERIYDLQKNMLDGVGDAAAVGGAVGFILNSAMSALVGRRAKVKSPEEAEVLDQAIEETQAKINTVEENNKKVEETVTALENTKSRTLNNGATDLEFIENPDGSLELSEDGLTAPDAESKKLLLERKYPNVEFQIVDNTDKKDPYAESNFTIVGRPKSNAKYSKGKEVLSKNQTEFLIEGATNLNELEGLNIENDADLQSALETKVKELTPDQEVGSAPTISNMASESVTVRVGDQNISGIVEVDEGGKATITQGDTVYEIPQDAKFTEFVRPVEVSPEGDFVVNGDSFQEARIVVENGKPKALLIRSDGTTKAITNPRVVEEIEYQITLSQLDQMSDQEADQILESYEQQRQTEAVAKEGTAESNETEDDRKLREATEEIQLIEDLALLELEDIESQAKLVEFTPPSMKAPKIYLVKKNPDGSYTASLNGRKVARPEIVAELGKVFEQKTGEDISKLQNQTNKLKQEVEQKLFPNATPPKQQASAGPAGERLSAPKAVSQKPTNKGTDIKVPIDVTDTNVGNTPQSITDDTLLKPIKDGKTKQKPTTGKSTDKKDTGGPKKISRKGKTPLDERQLRGKESQAAKLTPNTIEESALSWFVNKGRLSYAGLQSVFGQQKQGGKKNIQGEFNARRSFMRTPEKGGKSIEEIVDEIYNSLPESLTEKADSNPTAIKSAIENAIIENSSIAQMADRLLAGRGVDTKASRQLPPVEERSGFMSDAINQTFTPEEWSAKTAQEKAEFLNEYFDTPAGSEYEYTAEQIETIEKSGEVINFEQDQREDDIDFLSAMSDEELVEFEKNYKGIEAEFAPEGTKIDAQRQKVKDLADDLIRQIKEDKQGIIVDFEARAKADIKFFNTLRNLVIEYARLKGLQFNEFIADLQKLLGQQIDKKNREYLKSIWDAEKKAAPRKNVMTENKSMPYKDQVKQSIAELVASKNRELKIKLERERAKADERVKEAKDKGKEVLAQFENIKNTMIEFIKMDLKDIPVDSFTKGELNKILTQINKARTDWSLNLAISKAYDIFGEAGNKKRLSVAKEKVTQAKKNIKAGKIGVLQPNSPLDQMLRINPKIIPQRIFDEYESILGEVGARKTVLSPSERSVLFRRVSEVMKEVDKDNSLLNSLKYEYDNFEDKGETYSETLTKMLKEDIISEEEMEFMKLRKSEIQEKQETEKVEPSQEELDEAIDSILNEIPNLPQPGNNFSKDENKIIRFFNSIKEADLQGLTLKDLSSIYSLMGNLENNYVPHLAEKFRQKIEGVRNTKRIKPIIQAFKGKWSDVLSRAKAGIKNKFTEDETTSMRERIRMNPLAYIDQSLRNFKNTEFYDSTYRKLASAYAGFDSDFKTVLEKLLKAESKLKNQFESRSKLMMMAVQEEFESNPGGKVNSAKAWLDATMSDQYSIYNAEQKRKLQELFDSFSTNGEFDLKKAEKSLSKEEKAARKAIEEINNYLTPIADWTATVIRGNRVPIYENYIHLPRKTKGGKAVYDPKTMGGPLNPSTKSGTLEERTGKTHAISFDILDNVLSGAKKTLMDYYMTPVVKEMNQTFSQLEKEARNESEAEAAIQMSKVYDEVLTGVVGTTMADPNVADAVMSEVMRKGYQSILAGAGKAMSELGTNSAFAGIFKLDATTEGMKILSELKSDKAASVFKNVESSHTSRAYNTSGLDSRHVDFGGYSTKKLSKATGLDEGVTSKLFELAKDNKAYRFIDDIQSGLMSRPDQLVLRPLWMGVFEQAFKKQAGKSPDFDKIASNDQDYMEENAEAIEKSRNEADDVITEAVASSNPFDSIPKNMQKPGANAWGKYINTFNSFMTRFPIYEYNSAVRGVNALMGSGKMSRTDGAKLLTALTTRLMMYDLMTKTVLGFLYQKIAGLFSDQEEEEKEPIENILARPFISSLVMLVLNRNMGNIGKAGINYAVELANKEFGEGITYSGDYDGFSKSVVYPILPTEKNPGDKAWPLTFIENTSASMSPIIKTGFRGMTVAERAIFSKTEEARERNLKELMTRIPFEVAGNLGYIPMYKDFRKILLDYWYNSKEEDEKEKAKDESKRKFGER